MQSVSDGEGKEKKNFEAGGMNRMCTKLAPRLSAPAATPRRPLHHIYVEKCPARGTGVGVGGPSVGWGTRAGILCVLYTLRAGRDPVVFEGRGGVRNSMQKGKR